MPSYLDIIVVVIVLASAFLAMLRGFTREVLAIVSWIVAAFAALYGYIILVPYLKPYVQKDILAVASSAVIVFLVVLILVSIVTVRLSDAILDSRIGALDRTLGFLFGAARGFVICSIAFMFFNWFMSADTQPQWVANAKIHPFLVQTAEAIKTVMPEDIEKTILNYSKQRRRSETVE